MKNEDKINKARSFCKEVKELALKYDMNPVSCSNRSSKYNFK